MELIELIRARTTSASARPAFPEVHPEAAGLEHDLRYTKQKVDAGASFLITQLFFENEDYFRFVERAREFGIDVPIIAGIMPITNFEQVKRFTTMARSRPLCSSSSRRHQEEGDEAVTELGVAYATPSAPTCSSRARRASTSTR